MKLTVAVDPGKSGGYAVDYDNRLLGTFPFKGETEFLADLRDWLDNPDVTAIEAAVEEVPKFVGKAVPGSTSFVLGYHYGFIVGAFRANQIPVHLYRPQVWQQGLTGVKAAKGQRKKRVLRDHATRLYPSLRPTLATADAILILRHHLLQ